MVLYYKTKFLSLHLPLPSCMKSLLISAIPILYMVLLINLFLFIRL